AQPSSGGAKPNPGVGASSPGELAVRLHLFTADGRSVLPVDVLLGKETDAKGSKSSQGGGGIQFKQGPRVSLECSPSARRAIAPFVWNSLLEGSERHLNR